MPVSFLLALILTGCSHQQVFLPPGQDPDALVAAIASKGECVPQPNDADPPHRNFVGPVLATGAKVGETTAVIGTAVAYGVAAAKTKGSGCSTIPSSPNSVSDTLHKIWSDD